MITRSQAINKMKGYFGKVFLVTINIHGFVNPIEQEWTRHHIDIKPCFYVGEQIWKCIRAGLKVEGQRYYSETCVCVKSDALTWSRNVDIFSHCMAEKFKGFVILSGDIAQEKAWLK